jgi:hypothetical protein
MSGSEADALLARCAAPVAAIAGAVRRRLLALLPGVSEEGDAAAKVIGYGYGPGYANLVCTLILSKKGVKLGFYRGAELPDPHGLLTGSGKVHRYVEIASPEAAGDPRLAELIHAAAAAHRARRGSA